MKLIDIDSSEWKKGVFASLKANELMPIIHKIATIEMLRDWQEEVKAIPLDKVKKARKEIENLTEWDECLVEMYDVLEILDKLIESEGE